jgi:thymidylate synthase
MTNNADREYLNLLQKILKHGTQKADRTGTGTISLFGNHIEFDLEEGFPLLTTKRVPFKSVAHELFWFLKGDTNIRYLLDNNVKIWNDDAYRWHKIQNPNSVMDKERYLEVVKLGTRDFLGLGELGAIYGAQWIKWQNGDEAPINQVQNVIEAIKTNPDSRRHLVSAWNPSVLAEVALPPCHYAFQFYVENGRLSCMWNQRSVDSPLGLPFNIASYALLTHLVAKMTGLKVGRLIGSLGDTHIYLNQIDQVKIQLGREPRPLPQLNIKTVRDRIEDYTFDDLELIGYDPHPAIKIDLSVGN